MECILELSDRSDDDGCFSHVVLVGIGVKRILELGNPFVEDRDCTLDIVLNDIGKEDIELGDDSETFPTCTMIIREI